MPGKVLQHLVNGTRRDVDGYEFVWYDGYWIRYYPPPEESWSAKKHLIDTLTRRLFHHTEAGINTPGENLDLARRAYERELDPARRRVNGAMLAGALFNRAADIVTVIGELEQKGIRLEPDDALMQECERCFREALELGKLVKHYSGHEGIDELWGEPLKAFTMTMADFYESRYVKIALTMRDIDRITTRMIATFAPDPAFAGLSAALREYAELAKLESGTQRRDPAIFEVWPRFVAAAEAVEAFVPKAERAASPARRHSIEAGCELLDAGRSLVQYIASARVPMPKSAREYLERCDVYARDRTLPAGVPAPA